MKLYGTLGPACGRADVLEKMIKNGMHGVRLNLSHGGFDMFSGWLSELRAAEDRCGVKTEVLIDMEGPEIRIGDLPAPLQLAAGGKITLGKDIPLEREILDQLEKGMLCSLDDGKIELQIEDGLFCKIRKGGELKPRKSFAVKGISFTRDLMTVNDRINVRKAVKSGVCSILQPFVRSGDDILKLRRDLSELDCAKVKIYAKIEDSCGLENAEAIVENADYTVFARGDLGNNIKPWLLPAEQKRVAAICRRLSKPMVVATQLLSSMEKSPVPSRAELNDIYNSVLDGAEGLMLTGETAAGQYPAEAVKYLALTAQEALKAR